MNIRKYLYIGISIFVVLVLVAIGITAEFKLSNITSDVYAFIEEFFSRWSFALSATGTIILALSVFFFIYENRRREEKEKEQVLHALHDEIHWNLIHIITLRFQISERLRYIEKHRTVPSEPATFEFIETRVFDDMRSRGQLHWLEDIRMDIIFCYNLIRDYNMDAHFKPYHLELLATLNERYDKAIRDLEAKFKFLPHYVREKDTSRQVQAEDASKTLTNQKPNKPNVSESHDEVQRKYFLAQAPVYFLGSFLIMQASERKASSIPSGVNVFLSVAFIIFALCLCVAAWFERPRIITRIVKKVTQSYGFIPLMFFAYAWIQNLIDILKLGTGTWYFLLYYVVGFVLISFFILTPMSASWKKLRARFKSSRNKQ